MFFCRPPRRAGWRALLRHSLAIEIESRRLQGGQNPLPAAARAVAPAAHRAGPPYRRIGRRARGATSCSSTSGASVISGRSSCGGALAAGTQGRRGLGRGHGSQAGLLACGAAKQVRPSCAACPWPWRSAAFLLVDEALARIDDLTASAWRNTSPTMGSALCAPWPQ